MDFAEFLADFFSMDNEFKIYEILKLKFEFLQNVSLLVFNENHRILRICKEP